MDVLFVFTNFYFRNEVSWRLFAFDIAFLLKSMFQAFQISMFQIEIGKIGNFIQ